MLRTNSTWAALLLLVLATTASAASFGTGTVEVGISGTFNHSGYSYQGDHVASSTQIVAAPSIGYFFTPHLELNGGLLVDHSSIDITNFGSQNGTAFGFFGGGRWNFAGSGNLVPFVDASIGLIGWSGDKFEGSETTVIAPGLGAGLRFMAGDAASFNVGVTYSHSTNASVLNSTGGIKDLNGNQFGIDFGVSMFPIRGR